MLLRGICHRDYTHVFFGGRLIALSKKDGGTRPIVVGCTLRRLAAKCACSFGNERLRALLTPRQVGVATKGGCEAAVHATRRYISGMPGDHTVVKMDFANAFNSLDRSHMLSRVAEEIPELYKFCHLAYDQPSSLQFGIYMISSWRIVYPIWSLDIWTTSPSEEVDVTSPQMSGDSGPKGRRLG